MSAKRAAAYQSGAGHLWDRRRDPQKLFVVNYADGSRAFEGGGAGAAMAGRDGGGGALALLMLRRGSTRRASLQPL